MGEADQRQAPGWQKYFVVLGIIAIVVVLVVIVRIGKNSNDIANQNPDPALGPEDAKVVIDEYSDFQCSACAQAAPIVKSILASFEDKVRFEYHDYPLTSIHDNSYEAAVAGQCADRQDGFWPVHDLMFVEQQTWSPMPDPTDTFVGYAESSGLDRDEFVSCLEGEETAALVDEDIQEGEILNISGTPTIFVNGERFVGSSFDLLFDMVAAAVAAEYGEEQISVPTIETESAVPDSSDTSLGEDTEEEGTTSDSKEEADSEESAGVDESVLEFLDADEDAKSE